MNEPIPGGDMDYRTSIGIRALVVAAMSLVAAASVQAQIINGGFESGDFTGWAQNGFIAAGGPSAGGPQFATFLTAQAGGVAKAPTNGVVSSQTTSFDGFGVAGPAIPPSSGSFLAFVANETNAGNSSITGTSISQTFFIPANATQLSFDEVVERCGYSDAPSFRKLFKRETSLTPASYRERFRLRAR